MIDAQCARSSVYGMRCVIFIEKRKKSIACTCTPRYPLLSMQNPSELRRLSVYYVTMSCQSFRYRLLYDVCIDMQYRAEANNKYSIKYTYLSFIGTTI